MRHMSCNERLCILPFQQFFDSTSSATYSLKASERDSPPIDDLMIQLRYPLTEYRSDVMKNLGKFNYDVISFFYFTIYV